MGMCDSRWCSCGVLGTLPEVADSSRPSRPTLVIRSDVPKPRFRQRGQRHKALTTPRITAETFPAPPTRKATDLHGERNHRAIHPMIASAAAM